MTVTKQKILAVDDEDIHRELLAEHLGDAGYDVVTVEDGVSALAILEEPGQRFDAVLLDRVMPKMGGLEVLKQIKNNPALEMLPIILQTAKGAEQDILDGLQAGAYYYLIKPYDRKVMLAVVKTAVTDYQNYLTLQNEADKTVKTLSLLSKGEFFFRTLEEGRNLATLLANAGGPEGKAVMGLIELLTNAVEHGNLGITYDEKSALNERNGWRTEVERRLALPENINKRVSVSFKRTDREVQFLIQDEGKGFDWESYLEISPERAFDTHGRGIAMARMMSFDRLEYLGSGNQVLAVVSLDAEN